MALAHNALERAIRHAEASDLVRRNVASLVRPPQGRYCRPSRSVTVGQAAAVLTAAAKYRTHAYVVLSLTTGIRTEEARALRWENVDLEARTVAVWRSVWSHADVKTQKSRRWPRGRARAQAVRAAHRVRRQPGRDVPPLAAG